MAVDSHNQLIYMVAVLMVYTVLELLEAYKAVELVVVYTVVE
jgi:hypothetical protein